MNSNTIIFKITNLNVTYDQTLREREGPENIAQIDKFFHDEIWQNSQVKIDLTK